MLRAVAVSVEPATALKSLIFRAPLRQIGVHFGGERALARKRHMDPARPAWRLGWHSHAAPSCNCTFHLGSSATFC